MRPTFCVMYLIVGRGLLSLFDKLNIEIYQLKTSLYQFVNTQKILTFDIYFNVRIIIKTMFTITTIIPNGNLPFLEQKESSL